MRETIDKKVTRRKSEINRLIAEFLFDINPELYKTCEQAVQPLLEDEKLIPTVFNYIYHHQNGVMRGGNEHFYIAVFYRIYSPLHLYTSKITKLKPGVRGILSNCLGFQNGEMINHFSVFVLPNYKNPRWAAQVNELAFEIVENIKSEQEELSTEEKQAEAQKWKTC